MTGKYGIENIFFNVQNKQKIVIEKQHFQNSSFLLLRSFFSVPKQHFQIQNLSMPVFAFVS